MKAKFSIPINPLHLSFQELKVSVDETRGRMPPRIEVHVDGNDNDILFSYNSKDATVTVFRSGYFLFQNSNVSIIKAIDRCRRINFLDSEGTLRVVTESEFSSGPCLVPLLMVCDVQREHSQEDYEFYWHEFLEKNTL